jgi:Histidine kinase-like ATPase domain
MLARGIAGFDWRGIGKGRLVEMADRVGAMAPAPRLSLEPDAKSAAGARRWVASHLDGYRASLVDTATLLVSEVVTNAVLHAGTDIEVALHRSVDRVRIDVADHSTALPAAKQYTTDAATGRGLVLVEALATAWGVDPAMGGKVVWFELVDRGDTGNGKIPQGRDADLDSWPDLDDWAELSRPPEPAPEAVEVVEIHLLGLPLALTERTSEQYDALFREFRLMLETDPGQSQAVPGRLLALGDELTGQFSSFTVGSDAAMLDAHQRGDETIDVEYRLPRSVGPAAAHYDDLLDEADAYCRAGRELLTLAPPRDAVALRRWVLQEFVRQAAGRPAVAWADSPWAAGV